LSSSGHLPGLVQWQVIHTDEDRILTKACQLRAQRAGRKELPGHV